MAWIVFVRALPRLPCLVFLAVSEKIGGKVTHELSVPCFGSMITGTGLIVHVHIDKESASPGARRRATVDDVDMLEGRQLVHALAVLSHMNISRVLGGCFNDDVLGLDILQLLGENIKPRRQRVLFVSIQAIAALFRPNSKLSGVQKVHVQRENVSAVFGQLYHAVSAFLPFSRERLPEECGTSGEYLRGGVEDLAIWVHTNFDAYRIVESIGHSSAGGHDDQEGLT